MRLGIRVGASTRVKRPERWRLRLMKPQVVPAMMAVLTGCGGDIIIHQRGGPVLPPEVVFDAWERLTAEFAWRALPAVTVYTYAPDQALPQGEGYTGFYSYDLLKGHELFLQAKPYKCRPYRSLLHELTHLYAYTTGWDADGDHSDRNLWVTAEKAQSAWALECYNAAEAASL